MNSAMSAESPAGIPMGMAALASTGEPNVMMLAMVRDLRSAAV
ncbi:Uncharacterised protein [Mycobacteroides abscessus subsp. abscessus]|nr:Uncharacterised protein [Mycobacteroides abscessus subsp. abscessus]SKU90510.1 Uncharacterised protein [Mycobacteroides abscessus subsp. abscessus]